MQVSGNEIRNHANLIWGIAELLRGDYKQADYGKVILPLVVIRRLDQVLEERRDAVIEQANERGRRPPQPSRPRGGVRGLRSQTGFGCRAAAPSQRRWQR